MSITVFYNASSVIFQTESRRTFLSSNLKEEIVKSQTFGLKNVEQIQVFFVEGFFLEKESLFVEAFSKTINTQFEVAGELLRTLISNYLKRHREYHEESDRLGIKFSVPDRIDLF